LQRRHRFTLFDRDDRAVSQFDAVSCPIIPGGKDSVRANALSFSERSSLIGKLQVVHGNIQCLLKLSKTNNWPRIRHMSADRFSIAVMMYWS
jgi:hypothetical protein